MKNRENAKVDAMIEDGEVASDALEMFSGNADYEFCIMSAEIDGEGNPDTDAGCIIAVFECVKGKPTNTLLGYIG